MFRIFWTDLPNVKTAKKAKQNHQQKMAKVDGPDQPYSWIIALAGCVINTLLSGLGRTTGIFYVAVIDVYDVTRLQANLPFTLRYTVRCLAGPIVGILGQHYGVHIISVTGSLLAIAGVILCSFAPNILWISIFWGGFHGMGVALANTLFQVTVTQYFVKHRATASGLALSGACVGSFIFPIVLETFIDLYGLQGAFLMTGALIMHILPASMLLKEPSWLQSSSKNHIHPKKNNSPLTQMDTIEKDGAVYEPKYRKKYENHKDIKKTESVSSNRIDLKHSTGYEIRGVDNGGFIEKDKDDKCKIRNQDPVELFVEDRCRTISSGEISLTVPSTEMKSTAQKDSLLGAVVRVFRNPMFYMISFSVATFSILFDPLMIVIIDYIKDKGLNDRVGKYLISILAFGDLGGRLCFGWITDKNFISIPKFMLLIQLVQGICFLLIPLFYAFEVLMCLVVLYGISAGITVVMFPILVAKYLASEQSIAFGCVSFFAGVCTFAIPPLIGHFRDHEGSYDGMFYITGSLSSITGLLWLVEPWLIKETKDRTEIIN